MKVKENRKKILFFGSFLICQLFSIHECSKSCIHALLPRPLGAWGDPQVDDIGHSDVREAVGVIGAEDQPAHDLETTIPVCKNSLQVYIVIDVCVNKACSAMMTLHTLSQLSRQKCLEACIEKHFNKIIFLFWVPCIKSQKPLLFQSYTLSVAVPDVTSMSCCPLANISAFWLALLLRYSTKNAYPRSESESSKFKRPFCLRRLNCGVYNTEYN